MADRGISEQSKTIIARTKALIEAARDRNIVLRVLGGIAVLIHAHDPLHPRLLREVRDADLVVEKGKVRQLTILLNELGYEQNRRFNLLNGKERLIYFDPANGTQVDVFVGDFKMCHRLSLGTRLSVDAWTLPLAETLLTKLQIVELNDKDMKDILLVFLQHETAEQGDEERISLAALAEPCSSDWGLCKTVTDNLRLVAQKLPGIGLEPQLSALVETRLAAAINAIERSPKSAAWKMRAIVGTRVRWYELPEEVTGAITVS